MILELVAQENCQAAVEKGAFGVVLDAPLKIIASEPKYWRWLRMRRASLGCDVS